MSKNECQELKNIKYKTMLLNGNIVENEKTNVTENTMDLYLEEERNSIYVKTWVSLDYNSKLKKLYDFSDNYENIDEEQKTSLKTYLSNCLKSNKFQKMKDVNYDKETQNIISIPSLIYNNKKFSLKRLDKGKSSSSSLSLGKKRRTKIDIE